MLRRPAGNTQLASGPGDAPSSMDFGGPDAGAVIPKAGASFPDPAAVFREDGDPGGVTNTGGVDPVAANPADFLNLSRSLKPLLPGNIGGNAGGEFSNAGSGSRSLSQSSILPEPSFSGPQSSDQSLSESLKAAQSTVEKIEDPVLEPVHGGRRRIASRRKSDGGVGCVQAG